MQKYVEAYVIDSIAASTFGISVDSMNNPDHPMVINAKNTMSNDANVSRIISVLAPKIARYFRLEFFDKKVLDYFGNLVNQCVKESESSSQDKPHFLQMMVNLLNDKQTTSSIPNEQGKNLNKRYLTSEELTAQGLAFIMGGFDTTVSTLTHILYYLSKYPSIQQKLYEELKDVTDFSIESMSELKYLNAVMNETLRLKPPALNLIRVCVKDTQLSG